MAAAAAAWALLPSGGASNASSQSSALPEGTLNVSGIHAAGAGGTIPGTAQIRVEFSAAMLPGGSSLPVPALPGQRETPIVSPPVPGTWSQTAADELTFTPRGAFMPGTKLAVTVPAGMTSAGGAALRHPVSAQFKVSKGSMLGLQEDLAALGYLPLSFHADQPASSASSADDFARAAFNPPPGSFSWKQHGWPSSLLAMWHPGQQNMVTRGAVMAFQADRGLTLDGDPGPRVWAALIDALRRHQANSHGYSFAIGSEGSPESLTVWHDGHEVVSTPANTGIPGSSTATAQGVYPVYERLASQVMSGTNPDGSHYSDPVQWVAYFNGGEAVHYIARGDYGSPQSLGCIEVPYDAAERAWGYLSYGTLVDVTG